MADDSETPTPDTPAPDGTEANAPAAGAARPQDPSNASGDSVAAEDVELLLKRAEQALQSIDDPNAEVLPGVMPFHFDDLGGAEANNESATLELMNDVQLDLSIELGRTHMQLDEVLKLKKGAVVPLDKLAGDPADIYANGRLVARGEVLVLNDNFCVRVAELIEGDGTK